MTNHASPRFDRRAFLALIAAAGGVACTQRFGSPIIESPSSAEQGTPPAAPRSAPASASPSASTSPTAAAAPEAFEPLPGDVYPNAKRLAGRFVEALTTYGAGARPQAIVRTAVKGHKDREFDLDGVLRRAAPLLARGAVSQGAVVYPQLGGLTLEPGRERASVMVVVRQSLSNTSGSGVTEQVVRTVDVRLINRDDQWRIEDLADAGGGPPEPRGTLPETARRVLEDTRIELPDSARWDILRGDIDERLLETMLDLAAVAPFSVAVLKSGHPYNVFGTDLISGHTQGRGVDIWRVAGQPVVLQQPSKRSEAHAFASAALKDLGVPELGSPWDLDGPPEEGKLKPSFTDAVHADHIHVAFKAA